MGHEFVKYLNKIEYGITAKTITLGKPTYDAILERIHQVLGNLVRNFNISETYFDKDDPWTGILAAVALEISSTTNGLKFYSRVQLVFSRDMIIPMKQKAHW